MRTPAGKGSCCRGWVLKRCRRMVFSCIRSIIPVVPSPARRRRTRRPAYGMPSLASDGSTARDRRDAITPDDILVVAPYNVQVNLLRTRLPNGARVGTVDKFQGQEAPVVIVSMTTSSGDDLPRDIAFLFSRNRMNVAVSRAKCLALVLASPRLLEISCSSVDDLRLMSAFCSAPGLTASSIKNEERQ